MARSDLRECAPIFTPDYAYLPSQVGWLLRRSVLQYLHTIRNQLGRTGEAMTFVEQEIAHIARVMPPSLTGDFETPIMGVAYWRKRLYTLLKQNHLTHVQLGTVDTLLRQLDGFEARGRWMPQRATKALRVKALA
jgi:hypothetical protein